MTAALGGFEIPDCGKRPGGGWPSPRAKLISCSSWLLPPSSSRRAKTIQETIIMPRTSAAIKFQTLFIHIQRQIGAVFLTPSPSFYCVCVLYTVYSSVVYTSGGGAKLVLEYECVWSRIWLPAFGISTTFYFFLFYTSIKLRFVSTEGCCFRGYVSEF